MFPVDPPALLLGLVVSGRVPLMCHVICRRTSACVCDIACLWSVVLPQEPPPYIMFIFPCRFCVILEAHLSVDIEQEERNPTFVF